MFIIHANQTKVTAITLVQSQVSFTYRGIVKQSHEWRVERNQGHKGNINLSAQGRRQSRK